MIIKGNHINSVGNKKSKLFLFIRPSLQQIIQFICRARFTASTTGGTKGRKLLKATEAGQRLRHRWEPPREDRVRRWAPWGERGGAMKEVEELWGGRTPSTRWMKPLMPAISPPSRTRATRFPRGQYNSKSERMNSVQNDRVMGSNLAPFKPPPLPTYIDPFYGWSLSRRSSSHRSVPASPCTLVPVLAEYVAEPQKIGKMHILMQKAIVNLERLLNNKCDINQFGPSSTKKLFLKI